jgi:hypothetical protein
MVMPGYVRKIEPDELEELVKLKRHPGFKLLQDKVLDAKEDYFANLARTLSQGGVSANPVDQRFIDFRRGYWEGAIWALREFPAMTELQWQKFIEDSSEEAE